MISRDIQTVRQVIDNIQNQANTQYWEEFWGYIKPFLPLINVPLEQQIFVGALGCQLYRAGVSPMFFVTAFVGPPILGSVYAYFMTQNKLAEVNNIEVTKDDFDNLKDHFNLTSDQETAFHNVLTNIDWKINLKNLKGFLTEIEKINQAPTNSLFPKPTVNDILLKYGKPVPTQQMTQTHAMQFNT